MKFRVLALCAIGSTAIFGGSCGAPDPGAVVFKHPKTDSGIEPDSDSGTPGTDSAPPGDNAFTGEGAFVPGAATGSSRSGDHSSFPGQNPAGQACLGCHGGSGPATARFAFGGTVYTDKAGTNPAAAAEVRVVDSSGAEIAKAYTDGDGNFWLVATKTFASGSKTGARNASDSALMSGVVTSGDCNQTACHGGPAGPIHLP